MTSTLMVLDAELQAIEQELVARGGEIDDEIDLRLREALEARKDKVDAVVDHLGFLARGGLFVVISLVPTAKTLSDGRQAHISLHPAEWWADKLAAHFRVVEILAVSPQKQWTAVLLKKDPA